MGDEAWRDPAMSVSTWRFVDLVSKLLEPDERAAVRGDLVEAGASGQQALREVTGLVIRREAALWMHWLPWLALAGVVIPLGALLSHVSRWLADWSAIYAFLYVDNWTWAYLDSPGARRDLLHYSSSFLVTCVTLICWSWTCGFVLGALSRRTVWINGALFVLVVFAATLDTTTTARHNTFNDAVFSITFYNLVFPVMLRTLFVLLPALSGMHRGARSAILPLFPTIVWAVAVVILTAWTAKGLESSVVFGRGLIPADAGLDGVMGTADDPRPLRLLPLVMLWPVGYMLATTKWRPAPHNDLTER